jgi:hypothetical protein
VLDRYLVLIHLIWADRQLLSAMTLRARHLLSVERDLERDLELARLHGRWLSDDEHHQLERRHQQRPKLAALLVMCVLIPPLWPMAMALALYLLVPDTTRRLAVGLGVGVAVLGLLTTGLVAALLVAVLMAIF